MKIRLGVSHLAKKADAMTAVPRFTEGVNEVGRYAITLFDVNGTQIHESKGETRWHALQGLLKWGFDVEWEAGETPEPKPEGKKKGVSALRNIPGVVQ